MAALAADKCRRLSGISPHHGRMPRRPGMTGSGWSGIAPRWLPPRPAPDFLPAKHLHNPPSSSGSGQRLRPTRHFTPIEPPRHQRPAGLATGICCRSGTGMILRHLAAKVHAQKKNRSPSSRSDAGTARPQPQAALARRASGALLPLPESSLVAQPERRGRLGRGYSQSSLRTPFLGVLTTADGANWVGAALWGQR